MSGLTEAEGFQIIRQLCDMGVLRRQLEVAMQLEPEHIDRSEADNPIPSGLGGSRRASNALLEIEVASWDDGRQ